MPPPRAAAAVPDAAAAAELDSTRTAARNAQVFAVGLALAACVAAAPAFAADGTVGKAFHFPFSISHLNLSGIVPGTTQYIPRKAPARHSSACQERTIQHRIYGQNPAVELLFSKMLKLN